MSLSWQHCTHLYYSPLSLCLTAAAHVTHLSTRTHTYRNIWTTVNQGGVRPPLSLIGLDHDISLTGVSFVEFLSRGYFFSFLEWLDAPVRPGIFVSRTREKLGRTCDQIGRTLVRKLCFLCSCKQTRENSISQRRASDTYVLHHPPEQLLCMTVSRSER